MANSLYTPVQAAKVVAALVSEEAFLSALINTNYADDLLGGGGKGRTVNIKVPTALVARARALDDTTNAIVLDYITETTVPLTLGTHAYSAVGVSDADLSLDLSNFATQILAPQAAAVSSYIEDMVRGALLAETPNATLAGKWVQATPVTFFTALRKHLRLLGLPAASLKVVVGPGVYAAALDANLVTDASASGSTSALRDGQIGRLRGFDIVEDAGVPDNFVAAFHRDAYTLAVRAPKVPEGAKFGSTINEHGFSMRYLRDYDAMFTQDRSIVSTFAGIAKMPLYKVTRVQTIGEQGDVAAADNPADKDLVVEAASYVVGNAVVSAVAGGAVVRANVTLT